MIKNIDLATWNRKEHFNFYLDFDEPFMGIVSRVDCTKAYAKCKSKNRSFFLYYFYLSLKAANETPNLRYRIKDDLPIDCGRIHASQTILREDKTFAFCFIPYLDTFEEFKENALQQMEAAKQTTGLGFEITEDPNRLDVIYTSVVKWFSFSGLTHPRQFKNRDSIPRITFGKTYTEKDILYLPVSLNAHHSLMDGYHIGQYLERFQALLNKE